MLESQLFGLPTRSVSIGRDRPTPATATGAKKRAQQLLLQDIQDACISTCVYMSSRAPGCLYELGCFLQMRWEAGESANTGGKRAALTKTYPGHARVGAEAAAVLHPLKVTRTE